MARAAARRAGISLLSAGALAVAGWSGAPPLRAQEALLSAASYQVVDCLLPGQVRKLGRTATFLTPRRPLRTSAVNCELRGGEYVAADRATFASSLGVWLPSAQGGDAKAQAYVGRIYAEGFDRAPDYAQAAAWYQKAADRGFAPAMIDLGQLYERGLGVPRDPARAVALYRQATGLPPTDFAGAAAGGAETAQARAEREAMARELADARAALASERAELTRARAQLAESQSARQAQARAEAGAASGRAAAQASAQRQLAQRDAELKAANARAAELAAQLEAARSAPTTQRSAEAQEAARARVAADEALNRLVDAQAALKAKEQELGAAKARLAAEQARASDRQTTAVRTAQADLDRMSGELDQARRDAAARRAEITTAESRLAQAEAQVAERDARLKTASSQLSQAEGRMAQMQRDYDAAQTRSRDLAAQVAGLQQQVAKARQAPPPAPAAASDRGLADREAKLAAREAKIRDLEAKLSGVMATYRTASAPVQASAPLRLPASSKFGIRQNYALLIGEANYRDPKFERLATPGNDVTELGRILTGRYGFEVTVLHDKSRAEILRELDTLAQKLTEHDTLIIYYAGHGGMEKVRNGQDRGFWLPVDAEWGSTASQISNQEITYQVARMAARKVLIVADSCYSGLLTQTVSQAQRPLEADEKTNDYLIGMAWKQSRNVLTSGRLEPVLDGGGKGNHSIFAAALIEVLKSSDDVLTSEEVFERLQRRVMTNATSVLLANDDHPDPQQPTYAPLDNGGHVFGDFLFVPRTPVRTARLEAALREAE